MYHADQIERMRDQTATPYDRMVTQLSATHKWRIVKRKRLSRQITEINETVTEIRSFEC